MFSSLASKNFVVSLKVNARRAAARLKLASTGMKLDARDEWGGTHLHDAVRWSTRGSDLSLLLAAGADVNAVDKSGDTPLSVLIRSTTTRGKMIKQCRLLLEAGADPNIANNATRYPLHDAVSTGDLTLCRILLDHGADPNAAWTSTASEREYAFAKTPLHLAAERGNIQLCALLVERGASPSWMNPDNQYAGFLTPFQFVVKNGPVTAVRFFIEECGESLAQRTFSGKSLLQLAGDGSSEKAYLLSHETELAIVDAMPVMSEGHDVVRKPASAFSPL